MELYDRIIAEVFYDGETFRRSLILVLEEFQEIT